MIAFNRRLPYVNRNPLNIRYSNKVKWQGQEGQNKGFVVFNSFSMGYRAAVKILRSYHLRDVRSIGAIINTWAPPNENKTDQYIKNVVHFMNRLSNVNDTLRYDTQGEPCYDTEQSSYDTPSATKHLNLRNREEVVSLLLAMTKVEMGANTAQILSMREYAELGFDMAVTAPGFFSPPSGK